MFEFIYGYKIYFDFFFLVSPFICLNFSQANFVPLKVGKFNWAAALSISFFQMYREHCVLDHSSANEK